MNSLRYILGAAGTLLASSTALAGSLESFVAQHELHPVISLKSGYASINSGNGTESFTDTDANVFTYSNLKNTQNAGFMGVFLGLKHALPFSLYPQFFMQTGIEYNYFSGLDFNGVNTVGIEPATSTTYLYSYKAKTDQILGSAKLFTTIYERFHPYAEVGLGLAFNRAGQYRVTTAETGSVNLTAEFGNQRTAQFSYILGLGIDAEVTKNIRAGIGYRYSNFGSSSLGDGTVAINNYKSPVAFTIGNSNTYAHQLVGHISYLF